MGHINLIVSSTQSEIYFFDQASENCNFELENYQKKLERARGQANETYLGLQLGFCIW